MLDVGVWSGWMTVVVTPGLAAGVDRSICDETVFGLEEAAVTIVRPFVTNVVNFVVN